MKKILLTLAALAVMTGAASATDLPLHKKKHDKAPVAPVAAATIPAYTNTISAAYGLDSAPTGFTKKVDDAYAVTFTHAFSDGYTVGAAYGATVLPGETKQNVEAQVGYGTNVTNDIKLSGKIAVGERWQGNSFPFYAVYGNADYRINDKLTWNAIQYRYRKAFDTANEFESHHLGTGLTYAITQQVAINTAVYRDFDKDFKGKDNGVLVGVAYKF